MLWTSWDGPPSTRRMRWRDPLLDDETKCRLRARTEQVSAVTLYSREEEEKDPDGADKQISRAFEQVRAAVRREDPEGLWNSITRSTASTQPLG